MKRTILIYSLVVLAPVALLDAAVLVDRNGVTWDGTFEGNALPSQETPAWAFGGASGSASGTNSAGIFTQSSTSSGYFYWDMSGATWSNAGTARTVEFDMRIVAQTASDMAAQFTIGMDDAYWGLNLSTSGIQLTSFSALGSVTPIDTSVYHIYRLVLDSTLSTGKVKVYVDNNPTPLLTSGATVPNTIANFDLLSFTDRSTGGIGGTTDWNYISWTNGAFAPVPEPHFGALLLILGMVAVFRRIRRTATGHVEARI